MTRAAQLRVYHLKPGMLESFVEVWRTGIVPLREEFGFRVEGSWTMADGAGFVWIVSHDDAATFAAREAAYYESPGRLALSPDPGSLLEDSRTWMLEPVDP